MLPSIALDTDWGLSPDPEPAGPNAEALTGASTRVTGTGARDFVGAGTGTGAWAGLCVAAPATAAWLAREGFVPRLEWKNAMSATASAAHASSTATAQRGRRVGWVLSERVGWTGGNASPAM